jgi:hypothetical protein
MANKIYTKKGNIDELKGKLIKKEDQWFVEYLEGSEKFLMPLHPGQLKTKGLWRLKNKEVEFEVAKEYLSFRTIGDPEDRNYVDIYQNYAKLKTN